MNQEFDAISRLFQKRVTFKHDTTSVANGDDASVHAIPQGYELVISTDASVQAVHWPEDMHLDIAASRATHAALSDLAAMGAQPAWIWASITAENQQTLSQMSDGIVASCNDRHIELAGGDTTRSNTNAIHLTVGGLLPAGSAMTRHTACIHDEVWLWGHIGLSAAGLQHWLEGNQDSELVQYFQNITPLCQEGIRLRELGITTCIDISDGLLQDAEHIAKASQVGIHIEISAIKALPAYQQLHQHFNEETCLKYMLGGGEDYALLFTANTNLHISLEDLGAHCIGRCVQGSHVSLCHQGKALDYHIKGYDHFG